jgi:hypothetical protein
MKDIRSKYIQGLDHARRLQLQKLGPPKDPLKGRGFNRYELTGVNWQHNHLACAVRNVVPWVHRDLLYDRNGTPTVIVSPEAFELIREAWRFAEIRQRVADLRAFQRRQREWERQHSKRAVACGFSQWPVQASQAERVLQAGYEQGQLTHEEHAEFAGLVRGRSHPFTGRALELKQKSGLTWSQLTCKLEVKPCS